MSHHVASRKNIGHSYRIHSLQLGKNRNTLMLHRRRKIDCICILTFSSLAFVFESYSADLLGEHPTSIRAVPQTLVSLASSAFLPCISMAAGLCITGASRLALAWASLSLTPANLLRLRASRRAPMINARATRSPITMPAMAPPEMLLWCPLLGIWVEASLVPVEVGVSVALEAADVGLLRVEEIENQFVMLNRLPPLKGMGKASIHRA